MITTENLPTGYEPYQDVNFCSNSILGGGYIFAMGKVLPLLIGIGPLPRVWLQAVVSPNSKEFVTIVADSTATHPAVNVSAVKNKIVVSVRGTVVFAAEAKTNNQAVVSEVDFRPLGLNLFGNSSGLNLGGMKLNHNKFSGVRVAFSLGA